MWRCKPSRFGRSLNLPLLSSCLWTSSQGLGGKHTGSERNISPYLQPITTWNDAVDSMLARWGGGWVVVADGGAKSVLEEFKNPNDQRYSYCPFFLQLLLSTFKFYELFMHTDDLTVILLIENDGVMFICNQHIELCFVFCHFCGFTTDSKGVNHDSFPHIPAAFCVTNEGDAKQRSAMIAP